MGFWFDFSSRQSSTFQKLELWWKYDLRDFVITWHGDLSPITRSSPFPPRWDTFVRHSGRFILLMPMSYIHLLEKHPGCSELSGFVHFSLWKIEMLLHGLEQSKKIWAQTGIRHPLNLAWCIFLSWAHSSWVVWDKLNLCLPIYYYLPKAHERLL